MKKAGYLFGFILLLFFVQKTEAQDYRFSQFYNSPILLNPALTGSHEQDYRFNMNYRNQWASISNTYRTMAGSFDMPMFEDVAGMSKLGLGLSFLSDKAGITEFGFTNINLSLAYHLKTDRFTKLAAGILVGYGQHGANLSNVKWESQHNGSSYDPGSGSGETVFVNKIRFFDAGVGLLWTSIDPYNDRAFEIGLSSMHVNFPNNSFVSAYADRMKPRIQLHAEADFGYGDVMLRPKLILQNQGPAYTAMAGSLVRFRLGKEPDSRYTDVNVSSSFDIGLFYRYRESFTVVAQYEYKKHLMLSMSYDILSGGLGRISRAGGYEIALQYRGMFKNNRLKIKKHQFKEEKESPGERKNKTAPNIRM